VRNPRRQLRAVLTAAEAPGQSPPLPRIP
jgi:hypothetical protein